MHCELCYALERCFGIGILGERLSVAYDTPTSVRLFATGPESVAERDPRRLFMSSNETISNHVDPSHMLLPTNAIHQAFDEAPIKLL